MTWDVVVVGLGAAGSATLLQAARRGARALGIERFEPAHEHGSSHGETRITRKAIGEGDAYVPLVLRAYELWREIERETGAELLTITGGLWISSGARMAETHVAGFFDNTVAAARRFGIAHELLDARAIRERFPQFRVRDNERGYYEPDAGFLRPEACIRAQLALAERHGAVLHANERVLGLEEGARSVRIVTDRGAYEAAQVVLCAGAWVRDFVPAAWARHFSVTRQVLYWFEARDASRFTAPRFPVWIWELQDRRNVIYGFPALDEPAVKLATEQYAATVDPDQVAREVSSQEIEDVYRGLVAPNLPGLGPRCLRATTCLYTATPDFHFAIDRHPEMRRVIVASPCSGHGFKHSAAVGEALAQMALGEAPTLDLAPFAMKRFGYP